MKTAKSDVSTLSTCNCHHDCNHWNDIPEFFCKSCGDEFEQGELVNDTCKDCLDKLQQ